MNCFGSNFLAPESGNFPRSASKGWALLFCRCELITNIRPFSVATRAVPQRKQTTNSKFQHVNGSGTTRAARVCSDEKDGEPIPTNKLLGANAIAPNKSSPIPLGVISLLVAPVQFAIRPFLSAVSTSPSESQSPVSKVALPPISSAPVHPTFKTLRSAESTSPSWSKSPQRGGSTPTSWLKLRASPIVMSPVTRNISSSAQPPQSIPMS